MRSRHPKGQPVYGVSAYLSELGAAEQVCAAARDDGFELLFSSLHIPEDDPTTYTARFRQLASTARRHDLALVADISQRSLPALGLDTETAGDLTRWGVHGLRIDFGIATADIVALSRALPVYLNASTLTAAGLDALIDAGLSLGTTETIHNYYPKPHTGLTGTFLRDRNQMLHHRGVPVAAFVPGDGTLRPPVGKGLPTLEKHRGTHPLAAAIELRALGNDHVYIGDPTLRPRTRAQWRSYLRDGTIDLTITLTDKLPEPVRARLGIPDRNRPDPGRDLIRLAGSRPALHPTSVPPQLTTARPAGTVTVDNDHAGRYRSTA